MLAKVNYQRQFMEAIGHRSRRTKMEKVSGRGRLEEDWIISKTNSNRMDVNNHGWRKSWWSIVAAFLTLLWFLTCQAIAHKLHLLRTSSQRNSSKRKECISPRSTWWTRACWPAAALTIILTGPRLGPRKKQADSGPRTVFTTPKWRDRQKLSGRSWLLVWANSGAKAVWKVLTASRKKTVSEARRAKVKRSRTHSARIKSWFQTAANKSARVVLHLKLTRRSNYRRCFWKRR